jgi:hypothetical protein
MNRNDAAHDIGGEANTFCAPNGVTVGQAIRVLLKYLRNNPDKAHESSHGLAITVFKSAWRCQ